MYSYGPPHMAEQKQDGQLEHTYSSSVRIRDVALKTCQKRWTIGRSGERGSGISVPAVQHDYIYIYIYIYIYTQRWVCEHNCFSLSSKVKLATIVEGNPKAPFSIATTPRCRGGRYSFPGLLYFTLDPYLIMLSVKQGGIKYHFLSLWYDSTWDWTQVSRAIGEH